MARIKENSQKGFIVKSNSLIEARYRLSLQESQVILWLLTQIEPNDEDFKTHSMKISEFATLLQIEAGGKYSKLRQVTKHLIKRDLEIYETEKNRIIQVSWLSSAVYETKKGIVLLKFDPNLKSYLLQLKSHFTKINIVDTLKLKSIYSIRVFELLLQYQSIGKRQISIEDLRNYCGIEKNIYRNYNAVKIYVIDRAKTEISAKTEYEIDYKEIKESRKVVTIEWTIKKKRALEKVVPQKEYRSNLALIEALIEYGFKKSAARNLVKNNKEEKIQDALKLVDVRMKKGKVKNPVGFLRDAIEKEWKA